MGNVINKIKPFPDMMLLGIRPFYNDYDAISYYSKADHTKSCLFKKYLACVYVKQSLHMSFYFAFIRSFSCFNVDQFKVYHLQTYLVYFNISVDFLYNGRT